MAAPFCEQHRRQASGDELCIAPRSGDSRFCVAHGCRACVHVHKLSGAPIEQATPFACKQHTCSMKKCINITYGPDVAFCQDHSCGMPQTTIPFAILAY
jgi:hypothetical protein